jgi:alpha-galactosidase
MSPPLPALLAVAALSMAIVLPLRAAEDVWLSEVTNVRLAAVELSRPALNKSAKNTSLKVAGKSFDRGVGTQVNTEILIELNGATRFAALAGVDEASKEGAEVAFEIRAGSESLWRRVLKAGQTPEKIEIDVKGRRQLSLITEDVGNGYTRAYADWLDAEFDFEGDRPRSIPVPPVQEAAVVLTPKPPAAPRVNGARTFGARPGNPFLFQIPASGERPMKFTATGLPAGVSLDSETGLITGRVAEAGSFDVTLRAQNGRGADEKKLRVKIGETIALTPPMGWNSWNCWGTSVDTDKVLAAARAMASSGLVNHGWTCINIDDAWQGVRGGRHNAIQGNEKFPDLKGLADDVHGLGLKLGIYSTPWVTSYAFHIGGSADNPGGEWTEPPPPRRVNRGVFPWAIGEYSFANNDARQWAEWGIDYLKYDWNPNEVPETQEMAKALRASGRDIVYSVSNSAPFKNAEALSRLANCWRTTGDIHDSWGSMSRIGFAQDNWRKFAGPGHWNDPDMLVVGYVGWGPKLHPTRLTPNEQYTHISLWSLLAAPLLIGGDLERLDEFTLNLLTNDEVIAVNQDPLGKQAAKTLVDGRRQVWVKEMEDGSRAIGLFNLANEEQMVSASWEQLGIGHPRRVRDLWRQEDLDVTPDGLAFSVPRHGVMLVRAWPQ